MKDIETDGNEFINPVILYKEFHDEDFHKKCIEFLSAYRQINRNIMNVEEHVEAINSRCEAMIKLIEGLKCESTEDALKDIVSNFKEHYKIDEYNEQIGKLYTERNSMLMTIRLFADNEKSLCPLCFEKPVSNFLVPCGHTSCLECYERMKSAVCPFCRCHIDKLGKLYLSEL